MATQNQNITGEWTEIKAALSLTDTQAYTFQNTGSFELILVEAAAVPSADFNGFKLPASEHVPVTATASVNIYARMSERANLGKTILTVTEAA